jgi:hypothetical protein
MHCLRREHSLGLREFICIVNEVVEAFAFGLRHRECRRVNTHLATAYSRGQTHSVRSLGQLHYATLTKATNSRCELQVELFKLTRGLSYSPSSKYIELPISDALFAFGPSDVSSPGSQKHASCLNGVPWNLRPGLRIAWRQTTRISPANEKNTLRLGKRKR